MSEYGFGVDVGGTTVKLALFTRSGELVKKWEIPTDTSDNGEHILSDIADALKRCMEEHALTADRFLGIGMGIPGPVRRDGTVSAVNLGWHNKPIAAILRELTGLGVRAENDANAAALGELWMGSGKGFRDLAMITLGTGVGGGIVLNGKVISGAHAAGGEIGHIPLEPDDPRQCNCGGHGCFEQFASANGCVRVAEDCLRETSEPSPLRDCGKLDSKIIWETALAGDKVASEIVERYCRYLGRGLATVANIVDPEVILLGGGLSKVGQPLITRVEPYYRSFAFPACKDTPIRIASLGNDAGIYGCMYMLLS